MKNITVVIVTYHTPETIILDCLNSLDKNIKVIIIENSDKFSNEELILSKFNNVKILCSGENLGYGAGNNLGLREVKTEYALILNPDTICDKKFFFNLSNVINDTNDFSIIGCQYLDNSDFMPAGFFNSKKNKEFCKNFKNNKIEDLVKVDWVTGQSMLINLKKFQNKKIFDEKFFLYFEEFDLCKSLLAKGENVFSSNKLKIKHLGFKSSFEEGSVHKKSINRLREWHWMWSTFYFNKKYNGFFIALTKSIFKLLSFSVKSFFYLIFLNKTKSKIYFQRMSGLFNSIIGKKSWYRPKVF